MFWLSFNEFWTQPFWFFLWKPKCPSEVSEEKWVSVKTTVWEAGIHWYSKVKCT